MEGFNLHLLAALIYPHVMINGAPFNDVIFNLDLLDTLGPLSNLIILGLYPPANSVPNLPHNNATSLRLIAELGNNRFVWIDLYTNSPIGQNAGNISNHALHQHCLDPDIINDLYFRFGGGLARESAAGRMPIVYVGGLTVQAMFVRMIQLGRIVRLPVDFGDLELSLYRHVERNIYFLATYGPHLCAHLMAMGGEGPVLLYRETCAFLRILLGPNLVQRFYRPDQAQQLAAFPGDAVNHFVADTFHAFEVFHAEHAGRMRLCRQRCIRLTLILYNSGSGYFPENTRTLRSYVNDNNYYEALLDFIDTTPRVIVMRLLQFSGFIARFGDENFRQRVLNLINRFPYTYQTFMKGSFFARLVDDPLFLLAIEQLIAQFPNTFQTILTGSFCARLVDDPDFLPAVQLLVVQFPNTFQTILTGSFCARLVKDPLFLPAVQLLVVQFPNTFQTILTDSFCARLVKDPLFLPAVQLLIAQFPNTFQTILTDSFCARLVKDPLFLPAVKKLIAQFPNTFQTILTSSFCARLVKDPLFLPAVELLIAQFPNTFQTILTGSFCARLVKDPLFLPAIQAFIAKYPLTYQRIMRGGFSSRIVDKPLYLEAVDAFLSRFPHNGHILMAVGLDSRLLNQVFMDTFNALDAQFGSSQTNTLHSFGEGFFVMMDKDPALGWQIIERFALHIPRNRLHILLGSRFISRRHSFWPDVVGDILQEAGNNVVRKNKICAVVNELKARQFDSCTTYGEGMALIRERI